jgi:hypothetical protein
MVVGTSNIYLQLSQLLLVRMNHTANSTDLENGSPADSTLDRPTTDHPSSAQELRQWIMRLYSACDEKWRLCCSRNKGVLNALSASLKAAQWLQHTLYLFEHTPFQDPLLGLAGICLCRDPARQSSSSSGTSSGAGDVSGVSGSSSASSSLSSSPPPGTLPALPSSSSSGDGRRITALTVIMGAVMVVRIFDWVRRSGANASASDSLSSVFGDTSTASGLHGDTSSTPPAPPSLPVARGSLIPPADPRLCPLCRQSRESPCASTGGYVFCFSCLSEALDRREVCPVTGVPCKPLDVIRIYEQHENFS